MPKNLRGVTMTRSANAVSTRALLGADAQNRFLSPLIKLGSVRTTLAAADHVKNPKGSTSQSEKFKIQATTNAAARAIS